MARKQTALYFYRHQAGLSLQELSSLSGVSYTTLQRADTMGCEHMLAWKCMAIAKALGVDVGKLLREEA